MVAAERAQVSLLLFQRDGRFKLWAVWKASASAAPFGGLGCAQIFPRKLCGIPFSLVPSMHFFPLRWNYYPVVFYVPPACL